MCSACMVQAETLNPKPQSLVAAGRGPSQSLSPAQALLVIPTQQPAQVLQARPARQHCTRRVAARML